MYGENGPDFGAASDGMFLALWMIIVNCPKNGSCIIASDNCSY